MAVNQAAANAAAQQMAIIAGEGLADQLPQISRDTVRTERLKNLSSLEILQKVISGEKNEAQQALLSKIIAQASEFGVKFQPKLKEKPSDEFLTKQEAAEDWAEISSLEEKILAPESAGKKRGGGGEGAKDGFRHQLREEIFSELKQRIVSALIKAEGKLSSALAERSVRDFIRKNIDQLEPKHAIAEVVSEAKEAAKQELKSLLPEALENSLIRATMLGDYKDNEALGLMKLSSRAGFDAVDWAKNIWPEKKEDLGFVAVNPPQNGIGTAVDTGAHKRHGYEFDKEDEKDVLINQLRACYLNTALDNGVVSKMKLYFKMRKLRSGLIRLGIYNEGLEEKLQREGKGWAKIKTLEMVEQALNERATFYDLSAPAYQLVESRLKGLLENLNKLGFPLSGQDFEKLRDHANRKMAEVVKQELKAVEDKIVATLKRQPKLEKKHQRLVKILERLREESGIEFSAGIKV